MPGPHVAFVAIGSNLGDALANCRFGIAALAADPRIALTAQSRFYRTEPVGFTTQGWFVNAVVRIETALEPFELLDRLQAIQRAAGRPEGGIRFGPRVLDLDLLMVDRMVLEDPRLRLPHPRMHLRRFVLQPLCDIEPSLVHPLAGRSMRRLLDELEADGQQVVELQ